MNKPLCLKNFISVILLSGITLGCTENTQISFFCEKDKKNNYIVKWEVFPEKKENTTIEIFASDNDSVFPSNPALIVPINNFITAIPSKKNIFREYFRLKVDNSYSGIISNRFFNTQKICNFRDIGGYFTQDNEQVRWGRIYRSGDIATPTLEDSEILDSLKIKTVVDFRESMMVMSRPDVLSENVNYITLPVNVNNFNSDIHSKVLNGKFLKGDAIIYTQDCYRDIVEKYSEQYAKFFDILCDKNSYPVLFHCGWGKDRTGIAAYFILKALNVNIENIEEDYLLSNTGIDRSSILENAQIYPETVQEAITMLSTSDISYLKYAVSYIRKKHGTVENYMQEELNLTPQKIAALKNIMLYNQVADKH